MSFVMFKGFQLFQLVVLIWKESINREDGILRKEEITVEEVQNSNILKDKDFMLKQNKDHEPTEKGNSKGIL